MAGADERPKAVGGRSTLLAENVGRDYAEFTDGLGKVRLWHLGHRIGIFESTGGLTGEHGAFIVDYHKRMIETHERPYYAFGNWSGLRAYNSDTRKILTEWQLAQHYDELHVSHSSSLLAMGISMANAALRSTIQVHATEELLDDQLARVRRLHGL